MRLYIANLPYATSDFDLRKLFEPYGEVLSTHLPTDRATGRPRGIAFVEMPDTAAYKAMLALNRQLFRGRRLRVRKARPRKTFGIESLRTRTRDSRPSKRKNWVSVLREAEASKPPSPDPLAKAVARRLDELRVGKESSRARAIRAARQRVARPYQGGLPSLGKRS